MTYAELVEGLRDVQSDDPMTHDLMIRIGAWVVDFGLERLLTALASLSPEETP